MSMFEDNLVYKDMPEITHVSIRVDRSDIAVISRVFSCHGNTMIGARLALFCRSIIDNGKLDDLDKLFRECKD